MLFHSIIFDTRHGGYIWCCSAPSSDIKTSFGNPTLILHQRNHWLPRRKPPKSFESMHDPIDVIPSADNPVPPYTVAENMPDNNSKDPTPSQDYTSQPVFIAVLPLDKLQEGPAPVDCPACGVRTITKREYQVGNRAKYIHLGSCFNSLGVLCLCYLVFVFGGSL